MRRLFSLVTAVTLFAGSGAWAKDKYTFGEVPPPSRFPGVVEYSRVAPAPPAGVPPQVTGPAPASNSVSSPRVAPAKVLPPKVIERIVVAPPVAKPRPVVEKVESVSPEAPRPIPTPTAAAKPLVVTPGGGISGKVILADARGRFVILNFPFGQMPASNTVLDVFRNGVKVGEIKITGPQREDNTAADVVSGELQAGDVARNR